MQARVATRRRRSGSARRSRPPAGDMPAPWVIHAATMELGGPTSAAIIRRATAATLAKADELGARSLALVAFGTGVGGFPLAEAARDRGRGGAAPPRRRLARSSAWCSPSTARRRRAAFDGRAGESAVSELARRRSPTPAAPQAPPPATARLRDLLGERRCATARRELGQKRSGTRETRSTVALAVRRRAPRSRPPRRRAALRADPTRARERAWLLVAAVVGALVELAAPGRAAPCDDLALRAGDRRTAASLLAAPGPRARRPRGARAARVRGPGRRASTACAPRALALPAVVLGDGRRCASRSAPTTRCGSRRRWRGSAAGPPTRRSVEEHEDAVLALVGARDGPGRAPHEDPDPARRVARRILQRLDGMGKWGGYHTDFAHLARGFAGNDRAARPRGRRGAAARRACSPRSRASASATSSSTRAGPATSARLIETGEVPGRTASSPRTREISASHVCRPEAGREHAAVAAHAHRGRHHPAHAAGSGSCAPRSRMHRAGAPTPAAGYEAVGRALPGRGRRSSTSWARSPSSEIHRRTNALAHALADAGIVEGDSVAVMCRNHRGFIEATVALLQARRARAVPQHRRSRRPQLTDVVKRERPAARSSTTRSSPSSRARRRPRGASASSLARRRSRRSPTRRSRR